MKQIIAEVTEITSKLCQISLGNGVDLIKVAEIWALLPIEDAEGITYLEAASQCILEVSSLIDSQFPNLSKDQRTAKKFYLMAELLKLKANQLERVAL